MTWISALLFSAAWALLAFTKRERLPGLLTGLGCLWLAGWFLRRCLVAGRAPVTNMYESILWVALAVAGLGAVLSYRQRTRAPLLCALPVAVAALAWSGSRLFDASIHPLPPVLQNTAFLFTHVLAVAMGYAALALAMSLGHAVLLRQGDALLLRTLRRLLRMGTALVGLGTVLGALWANAAWGRFWGWDPKETWALITVLCYAGLIHGDRAGWWHARGLAIGSIVAFQAVVMAWYGVNYILGRGLHSYGFGSGNVGYLGYVGGYAAAEVVFIIAAAWKTRFRGAATPPPRISPILPRR